MHQQFRQPAESGTLIIYQGEEGGSKKFTLTTRVDHRPAHGCSPDIDSKNIAWFLLGRIFFGAKAKFFLKNSFVPKTNYFRGKDG